MIRSKHVRLAAAIGVGLLGLTVAGSAFAARMNPTRAPHAARVGFIQHLVSVEGVKSVAELNQDLKKGMTLWDIAHGTQPAKYASPDSLATAILAPIQTRLQTAVSNHRLTATQETGLYDRLHTRMATLVVTPHPLAHLHSVLGRKHAGTPQPNRDGGIRSAFLQTMATACGLKPADIQAAFKTGGKTPLAICQTGTKAPITQKALVSALMSAIQTKLEARAKSMGVNLNQAMEQQILGRIEMGLNVWLTTPIPAGGLHP